MTVRLRIEGTHEEIDKTVRLLEMNAIVRQQSRFYPNRGSTIVGRVYLEVDVSYSMEPAYRELPEHVKTK